MRLSRSVWNWVRLAKIYQNLSRVKRFLPEMKWGTANSTGSLVGLAQFYQKVSGIDPVQPEVKSAITILP